MFLTGMMGASIASFLGVVAYRTASGANINGRSHCNCGRLLKWYENVPIFGWLRIKGQAKCCGSKISPILFITELVCFFASIPLGLVLALLLVGQSSIMHLLFAGTFAVTAICLSYYYLKGFYTRRYKMEEK